LRKAVTDYLQGDMLQRLSAADTVAEAEGI
jgi:hypothetical protein